MVIFHSYVNLPKGTHYSGGSVGDHPGVSWYFLVCLHHLTKEMTHIWDPGLKEIGNAHFGPWKKGLGFQSWSPWFWGSKSIELQSQSLNRDNPAHAVCVYICIYIYIVVYIYISLYIYIYCFILYIIVQDCTYGYNYHIITLYIIILHRIIAQPPFSHCLVLEKAWTVPGEASVGLAMEWLHKTIRLET